MITKVQKWGNSQGLRFPKEILKKVHISVGDEVDISIKYGEIVIKSATQIRGKYKLKNLVDKISANYKPREEDWGKSMGKEIW
ncbi:AbrB/MazE/SpoVT family DNA-binding domain-containing protein [Patescibacteria group bacterium]|nr:AbrB/MazE/SpoVT family DNA-binding domain-containing protein [Patescibacteria group bacterium]